jgi:hypothetical protein
MYIPLIPAFFLKEEGVGSCENWLTNNQMLPCSISIWKQITFVNPGANEPLIGCFTPIINFHLPVLLS